MGGGWDGTSTQSTFERYVPGDLRGGRVGRYQYPVYIWEVRAGGSTWGAGGTVPVPSLHLRGTCRGIYVRGRWDGTSTQSTFERYVPGDLHGWRVGRYQYPVYIWEVRAGGSTWGAGGTVPVPSLHLRYVPGDLRGTCYIWEVRAGIYVRGGWDGTSTQSTVEVPVYMGGGWDGTSTQSTFERYVPGDLREGQVGRYQYPVYIERYVPGDLHGYGWDGTSTQSTFERYVPGDLCWGRVGRYQYPVYIWEVRAGGSTWGRVGRYQYPVYIWEVRAGGSTWGAGGTVPVPSLHLRGTCRGIYVGGGWDGTSTQSTFERYVPGDVRGGRVGRYQYPVYIWEVRAGGSTWGAGGTVPVPSLHLRGTCRAIYVGAGGTVPVPSLLLRGTCRGIYVGGGWDGTSTQSTFERYVPGDLRGGGLDGTSTQSTFERYVPGDLRLTTWGARWEVRAGGSTGGSTWGAGGTVPVPSLHLRGTCRGIYVGAGGTVPVPSLHLRGTCRGIYVGGGWDGTSTQLSRAGGSTWGAGGTVHLRGSCRGIYVGGGWDGTSTQSTFERYVPGDLRGGRVGRYQYPVYIWEVRAGGSTWGAGGTVPVPSLHLRGTCRGIYVGAGGTVPVPSLHLRGTCRGMYVGGGWDGTSTLSGTVPVPSLHLRGTCRGIYVRGRWDGTSTQSTFERYVPGDVRGGRLGRYQYPVYIWEVRAGGSTWGAVGRYQYPVYIYVGRDGTSTQSTFERFGGSTWGAGGTVPVPSLHLRGTCRGIYVGGGWDGTSTQSTFERYVPGDLRGGRVGRYQYPVYIWEVRAGGSTWGAGGTVPVPTTFDRYVPGDLRGGRVGRYQYPVYIWEVRAGGSTWGAGGTVPVPSLHLRGTCRGIYVRGRWDGTSTQSTFERYVPGDLRGGAGGTVPVPSLHLRGTCRGIYVRGRWDGTSTQSTFDRYVQGDLRGGRVGRYQYPVYIWEVRAGGSTWGAGGTVPVPSLHLRGTCRGIYVRGRWDGTSTQSTFERYVPGDLHGWRVGRYQYPVYIWEVRAGGSMLGAGGTVPVPSLHLRGTCRGIYVGAGGTVPVPSLHLRGTCRGIYVGGGWDGTSTQSTFERYVPGDLRGGRVGRYQYPVYIWEVSAGGSTWGAGGTVPVPSLHLRGTCRGIYVGAGGTVPVPSLHLRGTCRGIYVGGGWDGTSTQSTFERYVPGDLRGGGWDGTST